MRLDPETTRKCLELAGAGKTVPESISEKEFMQAVIDLAKRNGWLVYHAHDSRKSTAGFPDLVLVRGAILIFAELKVNKNRPDANQQAWLDAISETPARSFIWRPEYWLKIEEILK